MTTFTNTWEKTVPASSALMSGVAGNITDLKTNIEERLKTILYGFDEGETTLESRGLTSTYILTLATTLVNLQSFADAFANKVAGMSSVLTDKNYIAGCRPYYNALDDGNVYLEAGEVNLNGVLHLIPAAINTAITVATGFNYVYLQQKSIALNALEAVKDKDVLNPVALTPVTGDRYLIDGEGAGDWAGKDYQIAEYDTDHWDYTEPVIGYSTLVEDEAVYYFYKDGTSYWLTVTENNSNVLTADDIIVSSTAPELLTTSARGRARYYPLSTTQRYVGNVYAVGGNITSFSRTGEWIDFGSGQVESQALGTSYLELSVAARVPPYAKGVRLLYNVRVDEAEGTISFAQSNADRVLRAIPFRGYVTGSGTAEQSVAGMLDYPIIPAAIPALYAKHTSCYSASYIVCGYYEEI